MNVPAELHDIPAGQDGEAGSGGSGTPQTIPGRWCVMSLMKRFPSC
ncbi:hypothetical protein [Mobiluncus holmesii]|nr:hypothetical protein [Mobiluncus holmesii]STY98384.1 Uncharacterised protein [Mobiluncus holmesii]